MRPFVVRLLEANRVRVLARNLLSFYKSPNTKWSEFFYPTPRKTDFSVCLTKHSGIIWRPFSWIIHGAIRPTHMYAAGCRTHGRIDSAVNRPPAPSSVQGHSKQASKGCFIIGHCHHRDISTKADTSEPRLLRHSVHLPLAVETRDDGRKRRWEMSYFPVGLAAKWAAGSPLVREWHSPRPHITQSLGLGTCYDSNLSCYAYSSAWLFNLDFQYGGWRLKKNCCGGGRFSLFPSSSRSRERGVGTENGGCIRTL